MLSLEIIQTLFDYNRELYQRIWDSIGELTDEQFKEKYEYSHGSLRNQLVHVAQVDRRWLMGLLEDPRARGFLLDPDDYVTIKEVYDLWKDTDHQVHNYIDDLTDEKLVYQPAGMGGPVWQVLVHMINHGTDHRSQIGPKY